MKYVIASDIHGSAHFCKKLVEAFEREKADKLLLLGDLLYHGPRNALPDEYMPKEVIEMLNNLKDKIMCVRGNCDAEVDQMVLDFPIMAEYCILAEKGKMIFATHGHKFGIDNLPPVGMGDILITGHTHVPACMPMQNITYLNCGSVSIPKQNSKHSYMTLCDGVFEWKDLDGNVYNRFEI